MMSCHYCVTPVMSHRAAAARPPLVTSLSGGDERHAAAAAAARTRWFTADQATSDVIWVSRLTIRLLRKWGSDIRPKAETSGQPTVALYGKTSCSNARASYGFTYESQTYKYREYRLSTSKSARCTATSKHRCSAEPRSRRKMQHVTPHGSAALDISPHRLGSRTWTSTAAR